MRDGIGASPRRVEDRRFLTGRGRYVADIVVPGMLHATLVRSPYAHADVEITDVAAAATHPDVVAVLTGRDMAANGVGPMRCLWPVGHEPSRYPLARGRVRHIGEPVAVVVGETRAAAMNAAELVEADWRSRDAVIDTASALADGAPQLHDGAAGNVAFEWVRGDADAVAAGFASAAAVVRVELINHRLAGCAIEPRAVLAVPDPTNDRLTLYAATQVPHHIRRLVAEALGLPEGALRVVAPDVGGGFGYKGKHYPEETILAWAARRLGRPILWSASRSESFLSDNQARDHRTTAELALAADGTFLGLRVRTLANLGAYVSTFGAAIPSAIYSSLLAGVYRTPAVHVTVTGVFTNTLPTDAYRGAGRPEACYVLERLADRAAVRLGMDRAELRRRNLIQPSAMPYRTPLGLVYDSGDFPRMLDRALAVADWQGFPERRRAAEERGALRGIGLACYVESSGVAPSRLAGALGARAGFFESALVRVDADGGVRASLGTHNHGQGHATTFAQILAQQLGVPLARISIAEGDTDEVPYGTGTFGSRSMAVGGAALERAASRVVAKAKLIAAHLFEAAAEDVEFHDGTFAIAGTDRRLTFTEVARAAHVPHDFPHETLEPGLAANAAYDPPNFAFSNGAHVAEVEIDPETGVLRVVGYWAVDDIGTVINPMIAEGQIHGGIVQGLGQGLCEACVYDETGQLISGSFLDYALPRARDCPDFTTIFDESQPCTHNALGAKGCGEAGTIAAPAALVSAALDALAPLGIEDLAMPLTAERLWRAIEGARTL